MTREQLIRDGADAAEIHAKYADNASVMHAAAQIADRNSELMERLAQAPTDHVKEAIYDGAEFVCVTCPRNSYGAQVAWEHAHPDEREDLARAIYSKIAFKGGNDEHYESVRGYMYHEAADAVLAAGFRRPAQTEPTDAQAIAARNELQRRGYGGASLFAMRAALRAAFATEQRGENRD